MKRKALIIGTVLVMAVAVFAGGCGKEEAKKETEQQTDIQKDEMEDNAEEGCVTDGLVY